MAERYQPDLTLDSNALVLALINHDNNLTLTDKEIVIRNIDVNTSADIIPKNTQAVVAKARKPNGKTVTVYYDRLSAGNVLDNYQPLLVSLDGSETDIQQIASVINGYCGTNLAGTDIQSATVTVDEMNLVSISEGSPAWLGTFIATLFTPTQSALSTDDDCVLMIGDDGVLTIEGDDDGSAS
ncbi:virion structural protein [Erwinia phage vB_EamM_Asesino]|uniref:Virion structural protein n=1 Tax=Erwinia phage vB_EamM_Asesino TaxID=1883370 RepID=A0A1B2IA74_9CAUD|nr:virion structural protein [Erwinia phage vB_EamM_Asesino]ANZ48152.1 hypothetical protein ASESINO_139 [Erwinia phage vB_EamM_Asesino]